MNYLHSFFSWYQQQSFNKKTGLIIGLVFITSFGLISGFWALSPAYGILFNQLEEQDASQIVNELDKRAINYQLKDNGKEILIDKGLIAKTRLNLMSSGLNLSGQVGFELFDKSDWGMTDFSQKINYQRALQGELERTIGAIEEIRNVRIHLVLPEKQLFSQDSNPPKAAVTLHLKYPLTLKQVQSIQRLISASVPHLAWSHVVILDQNGNTLSSETIQNSNHRLQYKQNLERYLRQKVTHLLHTIFKDEPVLVQVDILLNYDEVQRELITPKAQGQVTHEKQITHAIQVKKTQKPEKQDVTLEKSYQIGSEKQQYKKAKETIERLSISVAIPKNTPVQTVHQIERLVKNAVGFNEQRGDKLSVEALVSSSPTKPNLTNKSLKVTPKPNYSTPIFYIVVFFMCTSIGTVYFLRQKTIKKRQALLLELTQWIDAHESI
ncbi:MAG: flagellar M-ring protein FliF [Legionella sp.]|nr:MAG: flagellar M-ring protein FliF [Legionella sp.]PJD96967.1 MAG: flagellar M-ring protein FliF [Legionella sp.]